MKQGVRKILDVLVGHGPALLAAMIVMIVLATGFVALTDFVSDGKADPFDHRVIKFFRKHGRRGIADELASDLTTLGGGGCLLLFAGGSSGYLIVDRRYALAGRLLLTTASGGVYTIFLKGVIDRVPPGNSAQHIPTGYYPSYPSGHATMSVIVYCTIAICLAQCSPRRAVRAYLALMAVLVVVLVGTSRVFLCIHWPTDVLAGWMAGGVWTLLCWIIATRLNQIRHHRNLLPRAIS